MNEDNVEEIVGSWVIHTLEHMRMMKRYPSDISLSSASSHSSGHYSAGLIPCSHQNSGANIMET